MGVFLCLKDIIPYIIIIVAVVLIRSVLVTPVRVTGYSMYPTFDDGQILLILYQKPTYYSHFYYSYLEL